MPRGCHIQQASHTVRPEGALLPCPTLPQGWRQGQDGRVAKLCVSRTRGSALRVMQALVLAGADASGVVEALEEGSDAEELRFELAATGGQLCVAQLTMWQHHSTPPPSASRLAADCQPGAAVVAPHCLQGGGGAPAAPGVDAGAAPPVATALQGSSADPAHVPAPLRGAAGWRPCRRRCKRGCRRRR